MVQIILGTSTKFNPGSIARVEIALLVADHEAAFLVDWPVLHQIKDHARLRLAPVALARIGRHNSIRMMRTKAKVVDEVDTSSPGASPRSKPPVVHARETPEAGWPPDPNQG